MTDHEDISDTDDKDIQQEPEIFASAETVGQKLAIVRQGEGISVQEVAERLNLGVSVIEAVEADDYDKLPGSTFTRGYVRAYANLLRLNPDELIAMLGANPDQVMDIPLAEGSPRFRRKKPWRISRKRGFLFKFFVFITLLIATVLALFGLNHWLELDLGKFVSRFLLMLESTGSNPE